MAMLDRGAKRRGTPVPADPGETVFERFGGWQLALAAGCLVGLVLVIDLLFLPTLMGWRERPLVFLDICTSAEREWSRGWFALALVLATLALLAALRLAAPRSAVVGVGAFVLVFMPLQYMVAANGGLTAVLESGLQGRLYGWDIPCPNDPRLTWRPSEILQQFYNPGPAGSRGGTVPFQFTDMLAANLALAFASAAILFVFGLVRAVGAFFARRGADPGPMPAPLSGVFRGPERTVLVQSAVIVLVFLMAAPAILLYATSPTDASRPTWDLLWVGPFILLLDLARLMMIGPRQARDLAPVVAAGGPEAPAALFLKPVADQLEKQFADRFVRRIAVPPVPDGAIAAAAREEALPLAGQGRYLLGTLKAESHDQIVRGLGEGVLDRGRTALVICPYDTLGVLAKDILAHLDRREGRLRPRQWMANTPLDTDAGAIDIIFAAPETLGSVLDKVGVLRGELSTLGGIFAIGLDRMDVGLLALGLRRLKPYVDDPASMISIVQSEPRGNVANYVGFLPMLAELENAPGATLEAERRIPGQIVILRERADVDFTRDTGWPVWVRGLVGMKQAEPRADVFLFDVDADHPRALWRDRVVSNLPNELPEHLLAWAPNLRAPAIFPLDVGHPAAVLKDRGNLADALRISVADHAAREWLRLIVTADYPGASFLQEMLTAHLKDMRDGKINSALENFSETYGSRLPKPRGGPVELALLVQQAYSSTIRQGVFSDDADAVLRQDDLDRIWAERKEPLEKLGISNTRVGLERLFRQTLRVSNAASFVIREESADRRWTYRLADTSLAGSDMLATYALEQNQNARLPGAADPGFYRLPASDHGLSYAEGIRINVGGDVYRIQSVDDTSRTIRVENDNGRDVRQCTFVRDYAITVRSDGLGGQFAADARTPIQGTQQPFEIATGYAHVARRTTSVLEDRTYRTPLAADGTFPARMSCEIDSPARLRSLAVLRIYERSADGDAGAGQGSPRGMRAAGGGRAIGGGGRNTGQAATGVGLVAFTLATTLQDVLRMTFRPLAHRIAVISPDAIVLPPARAETWDNVTAYCLERQPAITPLEAVRGDGGDPRLDAQRNLLRRHQPGQSTRTAYTAFLDAFLAQARSLDENRQAAAQTPLLTLAIIEDSDHDLGVARFFNEDYEKVLATWRDYLGHYARRWDDRGTHDYAFGANERPQCYDFGRAYEIVQLMAPGGPR
jgi:hypothetical protein